MEELQVWKLKASVLQARELRDEEEFYNQTKIDLEQRIEKVWNQNLDKWCLFKNLNIFEWKLIPFSVP